MQKFKNILLILFMFTTLLFSSAKGDEINIVYITDNNYVTYTLLSMKSLLDNNKSNSDLKFFVLTNELTSKNEKRIKDFIVQNNQKIELINCDTTEIDGGRNMQKGVLPDNEIYLTRIITAKLLIPNLLPSDIDKALYIDSDTLIKSDIKELYDQDISDYIIGMVIDNIYLEEQIEDYKQLKPPYYFNSGVLLFNIAKWREENIFDDVLQFAQEQPKLKYPDQDILNIVLNDRIKMLEPKWNNQYRMWFDDLMIPNINNEGIHHYYTKRKPWNFCPFESNYKRIYLNYWLNSQFRLYILKDILKALYIHYREFITEDKSFLLHTLSQWRKSK